MAGIPAPRGNHTVRYTPVKLCQSLEMRANLRRAVRRGAICLFLLAGTALPAPGAISSARECLSRAAVVANEITLGGDQSAARRELALALAKLDVSAARDAAAGVSRPADAARALAVVAAAFASQDLPAAKQASATGARLLLRISQSERRLEEQRLFLGEIAALGSEAPANVSELRPEEARSIVVASLARSRPEQAWELVKTWKLTGPPADPALEALAPALAAAHPDDAVELAASITSPGVRDRTLWRVAELLSPAEAAAVIPRLQDPVLRDSVLAGIAVRTAQADLDAALASLEAVTVSPASARAEITVDLARHDETRAVELARQLPASARDWALGRIALELAGRQPALAETYLVESGGGAELVRLVTAHMAVADAERALRLARTLLEGEERDAALSAIASALAASNPALARDLAWEITTPRWKTQAVGAVARRLVQTEADAATSLLGLISDPADLLPIRADLAAVIARRDPATARRLLETAPESEYRHDCAFAAALAQLGASKDPETALQLAGTGMREGMAVRWLLPAIGLSGVGNVTLLAERIQSPYVRALALIETARTLIGGESAARPAPDRARMIRPVVEWEGR